MTSSQDSVAHAVHLSTPLLQALAAVLPRGFTFKIYHCSTPPTRTSALYSSPPNRPPDRTYCTSHFLTIAIQAAEADCPSDVIVFAIEVLIYSTAFDTTFFVSKADSTGYLHLLKLPHGTPSPLRQISVVFLKHLIEHHKRDHVRSVISLFARSQSQYLFPGSAENARKHVQDDRGLIRWWCRVLDPLIKDTPTIVKSEESQWESVKGYLIVPGLETYETKSYIPLESRGASNIWTIGHPLQHISRLPHGTPPRCLIPRFPDDPKARYLEELDIEVSKGQTSDNGHWKSVKSIDQFWDMMAFRQECAAGRLVGFIWIIFEPVSHPVSAASFPADTQDTGTTMESQRSDSSGAFVRDSTPTTSFGALSQTQSFISPAKSEATTQYSPRKRSPSFASPRKNKEKLTGPIVSRQPRIKTEHKAHTRARPESTAYYVWRPTGRGQVVVEDPEYKRINDLLLSLDFANLPLATSSSKRWIDEVRAAASGREGDDWGQSVVGTREFEVSPKEQYTDAEPGVRTLNMGLVRKKRKDAPAAAETISGASLEDSPHINLLSGNMVRKKAKV